MPEPDQRNIFIKNLLQLKL